MIIYLNKKKLNVIEAKSPIQRMRGLMGISPIKSGMLFRKCNAIHTFFMKENIDVIGLDQNNKVIYIYRNLPKNQIVKIQNPIKDTSILEIPKDTSKGIKMGSILLFEDENII